MSGQRERRNLRREPRRREKRQKQRLEREYHEPRRGSGIRQLVVLITVAFMVTMGVVIGTRLSSDAIAVLVGVIAGVAASIPCALLLMAVTRRQERYDDEWDDDRYDERYDERARYDGGRYVDRSRGVPPVIVVTPGQAAPQQLAPWATGQSTWNTWEEGAPSRSQRTFRVMGYDEGDDEEQL